MSWLPRGTVLGELEMTEVYIDYDGPRLFSCLSATDQRYLAVWSVEREDADGWLYLPVSHRRLDMIRSGATGLRDAYRQAESVVFFVTLHHDLDMRDEVEPFQPRDLPDEWLPEPDAQLDLHVHTQPPMSPAAELERIVAQERRGRLRLKAEWGSLRRTEAPSRTLGELLVSTQNLYDNVGLALLRTDPPQAGRIPFDVMERTASDVVGLSAASFVIEIAGRELDDLFDGSTFTKITGQVLGLLNPSLDRDSLINQLSALRPRGAKSFRNFVRQLASSGADMTLSGAGAAMEFTSHTLTVDQLQTMRSILDLVVPDETFEIRGRMRLYRADFQRRLFGVEVEDSGLQFEGTIDPRAVAQVDHAPINELYDVLIYEFGAFDEAVGDRKPTYVLQQINPARDGMTAPATTRIPLVEGP